MQEKNAIKIKSLHYFLWHGHAVLLNRYATSASKETYRIVMPSSAFFKAMPKKIDLYPNWAIVEVAVATHVEHVPREKRVLRL